MIKNLPKKTKILCAIGISLFVLLICIFAIFKCFNTSSSVNETEQNINNNPIVEQKEKNDDLITISSYEHLYNFLSTGDVNNIYGIDGNEYSVVISGESNSIVVNDSTIFKSNQELYTVDLYRDIFIIYTASDSSDFKSTLYLIGLEGNIIKKVDNVLYRYGNFYDGKLKYAVDNYDYSNTFEASVIYKSHPVEDHTVTFLDGSISTDEVGEHFNYVYTPVCLNSNGCILYEKDGLKITVGKEGVTEEGVKYIDEKLYVNDHGINLSHNLVNISLLSDDYLFITSIGLDGYWETVQIIDWNGNIITDFNNIIDNDYYTSHPLISGLGNNFSEGVFHINTVSGEAQREMGQYFNIESSYPDDYVIGKVWKFNYLGNGHVDNGYVDEIIDLGDFRNYYRSKSN